MANGLHNRYRPARLDKCFGNIEAVEFVKASLGTGEVYSSYLFSGATGTGKTTLARLFASALNCVNSPAICGVCPSCVRIYEGKDFACREIDGASYSGKDNIVEIKNECGLSNLFGKYRIFIIDECHADELARMGEWLSMVADRI